MSNQTDTAPATTTEYDATIAEKNRLLDALVRLEPLADIPEVASQVKAMRKALVDCDQRIAYLALEEATRDFVADLNAMDIDPAVEHITYVRVNADVAEGEKPRKVWALQFRGNNKGKGVSTGNASPSAGLRRFTYLGVDYTSWADYVSREYDGAHGKASAAGWLKVHHPTVHAAIVAANS